MNNRYALVDLENVQPEFLKLKNERYQIKVFFGLTQKIPVNIAAQLQPFGSEVEYIGIDGSGKNALDFHIAFYIGKISASDPGSEFLVISKDTGYDPLLKHLRSSGINAKRRGAAAPQKQPTVKAIAPAPAPAPGASISTTPKKAPGQMSAKERLNHALLHLRKAGKAKPVKLKSLNTALMSVFQKKLDEPTISSLIDELIKQGIVVNNQGSISYKLP